MMLAIFLMLMCIVSLALHMTMDVTVHNRCPDIELVSPVYSCDHEKHCEYLIEGTDVDTMMKIGFRYGIDQDEHGGILAYEMRRKGNTKSSHQFSTDTTSTRAVEDTSKIIQLLVAWKFERSWEFSARIVLVEHDSALVLNEGGLAQLYDKVHAIPSKVYDWILKYDGIYKSTWLMSNNIVLEAAGEIICEEGFGLKITVSEGARNLDAVKPMWIDSKRQVSSSMI
jgi:hypothetical protein